jgi:hypothetical protein
MSEQHHLQAALLACGESTAPAKPAPRKRRVTLASAMKQVSKAGVAVARYEIDPADGKISIITGTDDSEPQNDLDKWIANHAH